MKTEPIPSPYTHNLVNALYLMKCSLETGALERACGQADQALWIAKRLGALSMCGNGNDPPKARGKAFLKQVWKSTLASIDRQKGGLEKIELIDRIPGNFPPVQCKEKDLREIFFHLATNATEAMGEGGKLIIRSQICFSTKEEAFAVIQIADTGPGIPQSRLNNLFLPFYSTKSCKNGNGLGLYLTRQLVHRNHGRITASSFPAAGATFTLEFPLAK